MFFFSAHTLAGSLELTADLFEKNEWEFCRRECRRALLSQTEPTERFQLLSAMSGIRMGNDPLLEHNELDRIISENHDDQVSAIAAYERGRLQWQLEQPEQALQSFSLSFQSTTNKALFLRASCSIFLLFKDAPELKDGNDDLISQITTSRDQWYGTLFSECAKPTPVTGTPSAPNWVIRFYRSQISPAIGERCTLEPSCSEYFHQANHKHGLKAYPMIADRFFREPEVSQKKKDPVISESGQIRYRDPIENHDFWMKKK
ncbi:MAG: membrane protein insertion efficiency factor YidD [Pontiella sp.]